MCMHNLGNAACSVMHNVVNDSDGGQPYWGSV
jgi:hypothetical protein